MTETLSAPAEDILGRIRYQPSGRNPIEARIAGAILEDPERIVRESITSFSRRTAVSPGSVVRFAKMLGLPGFRDLKLSIAATTAREWTGTNGHQKNTRFGDYMEEQIRATMFAAQEIEPITLEAVASAIARARCIDITATGSSLIAAQALLFSLTLLGLHVRFLPDAVEQGAAAAFLGEGDCLIAISVSGRTRPIVDAASRAAAAGATVIAMTCNSRSPMLKQASIQLVVDAQRGKFEAEWPLRTALVAVSRALITYMTQHLPKDELNQRRSTWSSGRFGLRY